LLSKLDTIQCKALTLCLGAFKGTALSSMQFECNEPPLHIRRTISTLKYLTKIASISHYAAREILDNKNIFKIESINTSYYKILNDFLHIYNFKLKFNSSCLYHPCNSSPINVDFTLINIGSNRSTLTHNISFSINNHINKYYQDHLLVYTDASKNMNNQLGISIYIPAQNSFSSFRLSDNLSVYHAELLAIYMSIGISSAFKNPKILILSDSLCSLLDIYNGFSYKFPEILNSLVSSMFNSSISFSFCYIPGHVDHHPHDIADSLAKRASNFSDISFFSNIKFHEIYNVIENHFSNAWLQNSHLCETGKHYISIFAPAFQNITFSSKFSRHKEVILNRLRLQSCKLNLYLNKIGLNPSPLCDICHMPDSVDHFLTICNKHISLHTNLLMTSNKLHIQPSIVSYLSNIILINIILTYIVTNNIII